MHQGIRCHVISLYRSFAISLTTTRRNGHGHLYLGCNKCITATGLNGRKDSSPGTTIPPHRRERIRDPSESDYRHSRPTSHRTAFGWGGLLVMSGI